jgi:hypothetical protein
VNMISNRCLQAASILIEVVCCSSFRFLCVSTVGLQMVQIFTATARSMRCC